MTVEPVDTFTPYSTVSVYGKPPTWMNEADAQRILAYQIYEQIYWNVPETFRLQMRGSDAAPIYIPTGRTIVDTTNRYLAPQPGFIIDPDVGSDSERENTRLQYSGLFRREKWWSKFVSNKRYGLIRGDWCWHILGNPLKPAGSRIKIEAVDPAAYFPVTHPDDPDKIIAVHIVEQFTDEDDKVFIKRQTYQRGKDPFNNDGSDTTIYNSIALFDVEAWESLADRPVRQLKPITALPPAITAIPVYHIRNIETPGDPFGSSELRGLERIMAAVNQAVSDEELALALEGLGLYETDGGPPRDAQGRPTDWVLGPGRVVEHGTGSSFTRVKGIDSVDPVQNHLAFLINALKEASATSDATIGKVDVTVAESGISLALQMGPMLSKVSEREEVLTDSLTVMYHDMSMWFKAYEGFDTVSVALPVWGSPIPVDKDAEFGRIMKIFEAGLADDNWAREQLANLGYVFPSNAGVSALNAMTARARATDPFASRLDAALEEQQQPSGE